MQFLKLMIFQCFVFLYLFFCISGTVCFLFVRYFVVIVVAATDDVVMIIADRVCDSCS